MATQSHTYSNLLDDAKYGVDGNSATCMKTYDIGVKSLIAAVWWKWILEECIEFTASISCLKTTTATVCDMAVY